LFVVSGRRWSLPKRCDPPNLWTVPRRNPQPVERMAVVPLRGLTKSGIPALHVSARIDAQRMTERATSARRLWRMVAGREWVQPDCHRPQVDAADVRLSRYEEACQCCTRCAVWWYWRGSEPSPSLLSFLGLWWVFAWGSAAGRLGIRRLLRALGVMLRRLIPRKPRALYDTPFVACRNKDSCA
jgi:hypothetical protein